MINAQSLFTYDCTVVLATRYTTPDTVRPVEIDITSATMALA